MAKLLFVEVFLTYVWYAVHSGNGVLKTCAKGLVDDLPVGSRME